jgi:hypothetical protein
VRKTNQLLDAQKHHSDGAGAFQNEHPGLQRNREKLLLAQQQENGAPRVDPEAQKFLTLGFGAGEINQDRGV